MCVCTKTADDNSCCNYAKNCVQNNLFQSNKCRWHILSCHTAKHIYIHTLCFFCVNLCLALFYAAYLWLYRLLAGGCTNASADIGKEFIYRFFIYLAKASIFESFLNSILLQRTDLLCFVVIFESF